MNINILSIHNNKNPNVNSSNNRDGSNYEKIYVVGLVVVFAATLYAGMKTLEAKTLKTNTNDTPSSSVETTIFSIMLVLEGGAIDYQHLPAKTLSEKEFWKEALNTPSYYHNDLSEDADAMHAFCYGPAAYVEKFFQTHNTIHNVLDLGCGKGGNSDFLLQKNITVIAFDIREHLLEQYQVPPPQTHLLTKKHQDITTCESYADENTIDVVIANDVLPYVPPKTLKSTMQKIHRCLKPGGTLIGSIFFKEQFRLPGCIGPHDRIVSMHEKLGAHYYYRKNFAAQLLKYSGFSITKCTQRRSALNSQIMPCMEFIAIKPHQN